MPASSALMNVYGLGAVVYHALTGQSPVAADADKILAGEIALPSEVSSLSAEIDAVVMRALATDPAERYQSAHDFRRALETTL